jgi:glutamate dehydrogenase (NAD(P)+)
VDIVIPAAIGNAITQENVAAIRARLLVEAANNPVTRDAEHWLAARGVTVIPDFVANAAAAFLFCGLLERRFEPRLESIFAESSRQLRSTTRELLELAQQRSIDPREAAERIAEQRIAER